MGNHMKDDFWTQDRTDQMVKLYLEGHSATEIAKAIGAPTRNTICGKIHRMKLRGAIDTVNRVYKPVISVPKIKLWKEPKPKVTKPKPISKQEVVAMFVSSEPRGQYSATLTRIRPNGCRYIADAMPIGDMDQAIMCGEQKVEGSAYCAAHKTLCVSNLTPADYKRKNLSLNRGVMWKVNQGRATRAG
jgi:GcrA cell cycle regulator